MDCTIMLQRIQNDYLLANQCCQKYKKLIEIQSVDENQAGVPGLLKGINNF
jgi:hypothetical protein